MSKVWLITGASRGLGRAFTEAVLEAGDRVVATARNPEQLVEIEGRYSDRVCIVALDVTNEAQAKAAVGGCGRFAQSSKDSCESGERPAAVPRLVNRAPAGASA